MTICAYYTEDKDGNEKAHYGTGMAAYNMAVAQAQEHGWRVIEATYELVDTEMVQDFTDSTPYGEGDCACYFSCSDDPETSCSLSGQWHVHAGEPCPVHPEAPGDQ